MSRHVILVGLPGSGKSIVGEMVAAELSVTFVDIDRIVTRKQGKPVTTIFAQFGEHAFREMERTEVAAALAGPPAIVAPGGGWAAFGDNLTQVGGAYLIYLQTNPRTAAGRAAPEGTRPLLLDGDPVDRMRNLLQERESYYLQAQDQVATEGRTPRQVAATVQKLARENAGL